MSETKNVATKVARRGIASARGTLRKKFSLKDASNNGLFLMHLEDVVLSTITIGEDSTGMPSFNGLSIPKLTFTFASNEANANERKYATLAFTAVESTADNIPGAKGAWKVESVLDWLNHLLNVYYLKGRQITDEEAEKLSLTFDDVDENGEYVPVEAEQVIAGWTSLFENVANIFNTGRDGAPIYKTADSKPIVVWGKLIAAIRTKKSWTNIANGNLSFPSFVMEGCIELYKQNTAPSIRVDAFKESLQPKETAAPKTPTSGPAGAPGMMTAGFDAGMGAGMPAGNEFAGMEESPF